jgi:MoaA/NifB/PqqE/SkfB family radical SAM enzyme
MLVVVWRITGRCPLRCPFCAYGIDAPRLHGDADEAQVRRFSKVLADYQQHTGQAVLVSWLGGEPLLWPALPALTRHVVHDLHLKVSATTNGMTLGAASVREHLAECYAELTLSIDGFAPFHDRMRGWPGAFEQLHAGVCALAAMAPRPRLRANTVLMRDNIADYPALCHELAEWGMDELTFNQLGGNDRPEFYPGHRLCMEDVTWLTEQLPTLSASLQERGVRLSGSAGYLERIRATTLGRRLPVENCDPGARFLFVDEMGHAAPCSFTTSGYGVPVDDLRTPADLLQLPLRFAEQRRAKTHAACLDCHSTQVFHKFAA